MNHIEYIKIVEEKIAQNGHIIQSVMDKRSTVYTVGAAHDGNVEYIILGLPSEVAADVLNATVKITRENNLFIGDISGILSKNYQARLRKIRYTTFRDAAEIAARYHDKHEMRNVVAIQIILPDKNGNFPGHSAYSMGKQYFFPGDE